MKYQVTQASDPTVALGAYSGYRVRLVAQRDRASGLVAVRVFYRGSESLPEHAVPVAAAAVETVDAALDLGYALAVEWIDRMDGADSPD